MKKKKQRKIELGQLVVTNRVAERITEDTAFHKFCEFSLARHESCDWGDLPPEDRETNDEALKSGENRFFSVYKYPGQEELTIWIITEWDHSVTTILFPDEY